MSKPGRGRTNWGWLRTVAWVCGWVMATGIRGWGFDQNHTPWAGVLREQVKAGVVDYVGIQRSNRVLRGYLDDLADVSREEFDRWERPNQLAFLLNLYNASTVDLVAKEYPIKSIREIGSILRGPWKQPCVRIWGEATTLDHLEHDLLRKMYREPRVHFALVCAARSCPPLRSEPYLGGRLEEQLEDQGRAFLSQTSKNRLDPVARVIYLSPIFQWFKGDFVAGGKSILEFVAPYFPEGSPRQLSGYRIHYTVYNWQLNDGHSE